MSRSRLRWLASGAALVAAATVGASQAAVAQAQTQAPAATKAPAATRAPAAVPYRGWPRQVYAPYYESWLSGSIATSAQQSGSPYETIAFLQTR